MYSKRPGILLVVAILAASVTGPRTLSAQSRQSQDSTRRGAVDSARLAQLAPTIVTGSWSRVQVKQAVYAAGVLDAKALRREPALSGAAILSRLPDVAIDLGAGVGGSTNLRLRGGEESFTQVMFDGTSINLTGGFLDLSGVTLTNVDRVEVARGPQSVRYGSSAMSGAVQFITREGERGAPRVSMRAEGGQAGEGHGQGQGEISVSGGTSRLRYSLGAGTTSVRGIYALPHDMSSNDLSGRVDARVGAAWKLTAVARDLDIASKLPVRDAGVTRAPMDPNAYYAHKRLLLSLDARRPAGEHWKHEFAANAYRLRFNYNDYSDGLDPADYPFFVFDFTFGQRVVQWRRSAQYVATWMRDSADASAMSLSFGSRIEREELSAELSGDFGDAYTSYRRDNAAVFVEAQKRVARRVQVTAGARLEDYESLEPAFVPRIGMRMPILGERLSLRASVGRAFKAPNLEQQFLESPFVRANPTLRPETSTSWEVGLSRESADGRRSIGVGVFRQSYEDLMRLVALDTLGNQQNRNVGESRITGYEVELRRAWGARWHLDANAAWLITEMVKNQGLSGSQYPVGSALPAVPGWTANAVLDASFFTALTASLRVRGVGPQRVFTERFGGARVTVPAHELVGLTLSQRFGPRLDGYLRVENLFGTDYDVAFDRPGIPRTVAIGVRFDY